MQSILYLVLENALPKVSFTTVVRAIGIWGYTPVRTTGVHVCLFLCPQHFVTDISGVGGHRVVKIWWMVDLGVRQVISPFGELWPRG